MVFRTCDQTMEGDVAPPLRPRCHPLEFEDGMIAEFNTPLWEREVTGSGERCVIGAFCLREHAMVGW